MLKRVTTIFTGNATFDGNNKKIMGNATFNGNNKKMDFTVLRGYAAARKAAQPKNVSNQNILFPFKHYTIT